ncbi:MAG TPA: ribosome recycling factor [Dehalococcoidia bacterium]|jgi:ribosome recycling factor|nr:ribosome recycling factor [Dehalococcoidia bacterium]|tara:strand:+ start:850 stop:1431 length:582 start_codon:yes stop_codon:yes gene_type:complete
MPNDNDGIDPNTIIKQTDEKMNNSTDALTRDLSAYRTGRANPSLVENIHVDYYGASTPLIQLATITSPDAQTIMLQPWDKGSINEIEKSLNGSEMGFNPSNDGNIITIPIPPLTKERRIDMVKLLKKRIEDSKVSIRNIRRDGIDTLRQLEKNKTLSQDNNKRLQDQLQKITDGHMKSVDDIFAKKEQDIMQI